MLNRVQLIGRVGKEPTVKGTTQSQVTYFTLATSEKSTKNGQKEERVEWHNIALFGKVGEVAYKYVKKGDLLYIEGSVKTYKYLHDNVEKLGVLSRFLTCC